MFNFSISQEMDYGNSSEATSICVSLKSNSFSSDYDADEALDKILSVVGAAKRFMLVPCDNINNAVAYTSETGLRYIVYDVEFMNSITTGDNYWSNMAILAHEVGHHINGHTLSGDLSQYESRLEELEADEFAGFVLSKLGADIEVVKNVFDEISFDGDDTYSSHPNRTRRLNAIERGYEKARNNGNITQTKLSTFDEYFYRGKENIDNGNYSKGLEDYNEALKIQKDYVAYFNRSIAKDNLGDIPGALSDLYRSLEMNPNYVPALAAYSRIEYDKNNFNSFYSGISYGLKALENLNQDDPDRVLINFRIGYMFNALDIKDKALEFLLDADNQSEGKDKYWDATIDVILGEVYMSIDSISKGRNLFKSAMNLNGSEDHYIPYRIGYSNLYILEDYNEAIKYFSKALELEEDETYYRERSYAYSYLATEDKNKYYQAIIDITKAIDINPDNGDHYIVRGDYRNSLGISGACDDWLKAIDLEWNTERVINSLVENCGYSKEDFYSNSDWYSLGIDEYNEGNYEEAISFFNKSILLPGVDYMDYKYRAASYFNLERYEEAINDYKKVIELEPESPGFHFRIAESLIELNQYNEAIIEFDKDDDILLSYLYTDDTRKEFDIEYIQNSPYYIFEISETRDVIYEKKDISLEERLKFLEITQNALISALSDPEDDNTLYSLGLNTLNFIEISEDKFTSIIKINEVIELIDNLNHTDNYLVKAYLIEKRGDIKTEIGDKNGACNDYQLSLELFEEYKEIFEEEYNRVKELISENCN